MMLEILVADNERFLQQHGADACLERLSRQRGEKACSCKSESAKRQSIVAGFLLEENLHGHVGEIEYAFSERGKPCLKGGDAPHFSISHCEKYSACVVSKNPVGVDVEKVGRGKLAEAERFFCERESRLLKSLSGAAQNHAFTVLWTAKEAVSKCFDVPLAEVCHRTDFSSIVFEMGKKPCYVSTASSGFVRIKSFTFDGHVLTCADVEAEDFSLKFIDK